MIPRAPHCNSGNSGAAWRGRTGKLRPKATQCLSEPSRAAPAVTTRGSTPRGRPRCAPSRARPPGPPAHRRPGRARPRRHARRTGPAARRRAAAAPGTARGSGRHLRRRHPPPAPGSPPHPPARQAHAGFSWRCREPASHYGTIAQHCCAGLASCRQCLRSPQPSGRAHPNPSSGDEHGAYDEQAAHARPAALPGTACSTDFPRALPFLAAANPNPNHAPLRAERGAPKVLTIQAGCHPGGPPSLRQAGAGTPPSYRNGQQGPPRRATGGRPPERPPGRSAPGGRRRHGRPSRTRARLPRPTAPGTFPGAAARAVAGLG